MITDTEELHLQLQLLQKENALQKEIIASFNNQKYFEIEKTGFNYIIRTDSMDFYRVGMTKNLEKRIKSHQTSNEATIEVLHQFKTSNPRLLESCVHYALQIYRCNSNREFFRCNHQHIQNVMEILGHVLDTCRSSSEEISREELLEKIFEKLELIHFAKDNLIKSDIDEWVSKHVLYKKGELLNAKDLHQKYFDGRKVSFNQKGVFRKEFEKSIKMFLKEYPTFETKMNSHRSKDNKTVKGWKNIMLV